MNDVLTKVRTHYASGDHDCVVQVVEGISVEDLHYKALGLVGKSFITLSDPARALPYLVRSFYLGPSHKKLIQIRKLAQDTGNLSYMDGMIEFVFAYHQDDADLISYLGPFLPTFTSTEGLGAKDRLIAFYSFAERGRSKEAVEIGRQLLAEEFASEALRQRMADLLFGLGKIEEAMKLVDVLPGEFKNWRRELQTVVRPWNFNPGIIVVCDVTALGDFIQRLTAACKIKVNSPSCHVAFCYRPDRGFKTDLIRCAVGIDEFLALDDLSAEAVEQAIGVSRYHRSVILETDSAFIFAVGSYEGQPCLRVPPGDVEDLSNELTKAGVDPARWFVTLHYRQGNSAPTPHLEPIRDVQAGNFHDLAKFVVDELGGQVVRLGHAGMDKLPDQPGYIDLSEASIALQLFATSRSRFMIGTDSGMVSFAIAFAIPTGRTNVTYDIATENPADIILLKNLISLDGHVISTARQFQSGKGIIALFRLETRRNFKIFDNTPEQLIVVAQRLFDKTGDVEGWRETLPLAQDSKCIGPFPMNWARTATVIDLADMIDLPLRQL